MHKWVLPVPVPPCRKKLERDADYDLPPKMWTRQYGGPITAPSVAPSDHVNEDRIVATGQRPPLLEERLRRSTPVHKHGTAPC